LNKIIKYIDIDSARVKLNNEDVMAVDIRDQESFNAGHINGAIHLSNNNFDKFSNSTDKNNTIIVYCYHGNSSQKAAQLLMNFGFLDVYSLNGGYEEWKTKLERI
jgi:rhodanese-related sulfurtransferase